MEVIRQVVKARCCRAFMSCGPSWMLPTRLSMSDTSIVVMKRRSVSLATLAAIACAPNTLISRLTQYLQARLSGARLVLSKIRNASSKYCKSARHYGVQPQRDTEVVAAGEHPF